MKGRILIIDDNALDVKLATTALERSGYACFGFVDHREAFKWLEKNIPQIIVLDLQLTDITGFELIPLLRAHAHSSKIPIIIMSGKNQAEDVKKAIQLGATDYIVKPLDPMVLQEKVSKVGSENTEEFFSSDWNDETQSLAYFGSPVRIVSISEFGMTVASPEAVKTGASLEIVGLKVDLLGSETILLRCLSSEKSHDQRTYLSQFTYVGMLEAQRQVIRKFCRQLYVQNKGGIE